MAQELDALCDGSGAIEQLKVVITQRPSTPYAALARAYYQLGIVHDRSGRRSDAIAAYKNASAANPRDDRMQLGEKIRRAIARMPPSAVCR
jgi:tetratricopeptide (TPR) repeat protein